MAETQTMAPGASENIEAHDSARPRYRRRHWIIDPVLQGRYLFHLFTVSAVVGMAVGYGVVNYFLYLEGNLTGADWNDVVRLAVETSLFALAVVIVSSVFLSHHIAGPGYRLRRAAEQIIAGDLRFRIRLRRHDHLKPTADAFNRLLDTLEEREKTRASERTEIANAIRAALDKLIAPGQSELPEALRLLEEAAARLDGSRE
jgi:methyl-accepting chemotaxis protein